MADVQGSIVALDVGEARVGVAAASIAARLASPLKTLTRDSATIDHIVQLCASEQAAAIVLGLPRGLAGQETAQTTATREFAAELERRVGLPLFWQDEAVTSRQAEAELKARGKPYVRGDIDALAATYILEDFLNEHSAGELSKLAEQAAGAVNRLANRRTQA